MKTRAQDDISSAAIFATAATVVGVGIWTLAPRRSTTMRSQNIKARLTCHRWPAAGDCASSGSPEELYSRWRDLSRLPELIPHLESVTPIDQTRSRWVLMGPRDLRLSWEAELVADEPGRLIARRSIEGADDPAPLAT